MRFTAELPLVIRLGPAHRRANGGDQPPRQRTGRDLMLGGRVTDVGEDERMLTFRTPNGEQRDVRIPDDALIMRDRRRSRFEEIEPGDMVRLRLERRDDGTRIAVRMMVCSVPRR